jgi:pimeloyl-ACP methyl ester carboxylesterase
VLEFEDLDQVVLVGHSYGGMVITGVADRRPQRLAQLVYLDAEVPADGQCEFDLLEPAERADYQLAATTKGEGWRIPPPVPEPLPEGSGRQASLGHVADGAPGDQRLHPDTALTNPAGGGGADILLCTQGKEGQRSWPCPVGPIRPRVAVRGARGRPRGPRDRTPAARLNGTGSLPLGGDVAAAVAGGALSKVLDYVRAWSQR